MKSTDGVKWAVNQLGKRLTDGQPYGAQCATFIIEFTKEHWEVWPKGDAKDFINYKWPKGFQVLKGKDQIPQIGDIFVFGGKHGHTGLVTEANGKYFNSIDQNWYNANLETGSPVAFIEDHDYSDFLGVIRPPYSDAVKGKSKKSTKIETINETINYQMPRRNGSVQGVVIHNTASSATAKQDYNNLLNASTQRYTAGIAHYYIDRHTVWRAIDTFSIGWHVADAYGNNGFIGYEVDESMSASNKDFMANEQATFKKAAADLLYYGLPVNRDTVWLHCEFVPTECPHRSMTLHTGWNPSTQGKAPQSIVNQLKDYFIKEIKKYYNNPALKAGAPASDDVPDRNTIPESKPNDKPVNTEESPAPAKSIWQQNQYGTWYMTERATFVNGAEPIQVWNVGPFRILGNEAANLPAGVAINYDEVMLQDGHCWVGYDGYNNERLYLPVREWNGTPPPNHVKGLGDLWGRIE